MPHQIGTTTVAEQSIFIHLKVSCPEESRNALINALGATMRWEATYAGDDKRTDLSIDKSFSVGRITNLI